MLQWGSLTIFCGALNLKLRDCAEGEGIGVPTNENFTGTPLPDTRGGSRGGAGEGAAAPFSAALYGAAAPVKSSTDGGRLPRFNATITL